MSDIQSLWNNTWKDLKRSQIADRGFGRADVRAGGRATKAYPNKEDESWWQDNGLGMVDTWVQWRNGSGWSIATMPDGQPAIELEIEVEIGGIPVKMVIDRLMTVTPTPTAPTDYVVLDLKTGKTTPSSALQLGLYATGIELVYGIRPAWGTYWMAREGTVTEPETLDLYNLEFFTDLFSKFKTAREHGVFLPNFNACKMCSVVEYCKYKTQQPLEIK